jgi:cobyrinic acid a,c-diamide synthase
MASMGSVLSVVVQVILLIFVNPVGMNSDSEMIPTLVIAGTHSGVGKTSIALGLMRALARQGVRVQPFKVGPDFIDPGHHDRAAGRRSRNLDSWMLSPAVCRGLFQRAAADCDLAIVEGVMGLFDGRGSTAAGSTAELAKVLGAPVLLVIDGRGLSRSAAALVAGYGGFDRDLDLAGVIVNRVGSDRHGALIAAALEPGPVPVLGWVRRCENFAIASRHLGLHLAAEADGGESHLDALAEAIAGALDLDGVMALGRSTVPRSPDLTTDLWNLDVARGLSPLSQGDGVRIGIAQDAAFCFYYPDSLAILENLGAQLVPFSPLADRALPPDLDGLFIGGGYPELHGPAIAANESLRRAIADFCAQGRPVYAECGGLMYLGRSIETRAGDRYPAVGIFPFRTRLTGRPTLGYVDLDILDFFGEGAIGETIRGHRFHYSEIVWDENDGANLGGDRAIAKPYRLTDSRGTVQPAGYRMGNTIASYVHLHFASNPAIARAFVAACRQEA